MPKITILDIYKKKAEGKKITMLTAYDYPTAQIVDQAGIDMILVGDSLGMVVQGVSSTLPVTMDEMIYHTKMVSRAAQSAMVVGDMPFLSYQTDKADAVRNAGRFLKEAGAEAVKLEGGTPDGRGHQGDRERRHPGRGPYRTYPAVCPYARRVQGPGQE